MLTTRDAALLALAFVSGSAATLVPKLMLRTGCDVSCGADAASGAPLPLAAPVYAATLVFVAALLGLAGETLWGCTASGRRTGVARWPAMRARAARLLSPALLSVGALLLQLLALLFISAAAMAGLRGALILATAVLSAAMGLKDRPASGAEWRCVYAAAAGAVLVGAGSELQAALVPAAANGDAGGDSSAGGGVSGAAAVAIGTAASLVGYALAAGQVALEHVALDPPAPAPPSGVPPDGDDAATALPPVPLPPPLSKWQIMGIEAVYGLGVCGAALGALAAVRSAGGGVGGLPLDDPARTLCCLRTTPALCWLSVAYGALSLTFNACLLSLSASVGPSFRVFAFTARGLLTWGVETALFYAGGPADYGEALSPYSLLVLAGYALLIGSGLWRVVLQRRAAPAPADDELEPGAAKSLAAALLEPEGAGLEPAADSDARAPFLPSAAASHGRDRGHR